MTPEDRKPRPYSTLRDGRVVWVTPEEHATIGKAGRVRLENDDEVRLRLVRAGHSGYKSYKGKDLDDWLRYWSMPPRQYVDES